MQPTTAWRHDIPASLVVFFVAVPLGLGIALTSGAPLISGVIAGIVGGIVVGALSGSHLMVSGPAAGMSVVLISALAALGSFERLLAAIVIAGLLQLLFGVLRGGIIGYYFPSPVIRGMMSAIGLILVLKQIPHALGYDVDAMGDETFLQANDQTTFSALPEAFTHIAPGAFVIAAVSLAVFGIWGRGPLKRVKSFPAPIVVVALAVALNEYFHAKVPLLALTSSHLVSLPVASSVGDFFAQLSTPAWSAFVEPNVWRVAVMLAVVASLESLLSLQATDDLDPHKREASPDRELLAQGAGNVVSGLLGGLPVTGVVVRSATNVAAGAQTRWSSILHGVWILLAATLVPSFLNRIPLAALASILIVIGWRLAHPRVFRDAWRRGKAFAVPFLATVVAILLTDPLRGILAGLLVGVVLIMRDHVASPPFTEVSPKGAVLRRLRLHENLNFLHRASLWVELENVPPGSRIEIDARDTRRIDPDVREILFNFRETARLREIDYRLVGLEFPPESPTN